MCAVGSALAFILQVFSFYRIRTTNLVYLPYKKLKSRNQGINQKYLIFFPPFNIKDRIQLHLLSYKIPYMPLFLSFISNLYISSVA